MALLDKVLGRNDKEDALRQEIKSIELRKTSVFATIDGEIARLQNERSNVLLGAGTEAFEAWNQGNSQPDLTAFWHKVQELDKLIAEQEAKKVEMGARYNEEIKLISGNLSIDTENSKLFKTCPRCKGQVGISDEFCQTCGTRL